MDLLLAAACDPFEPSGNSDYGPLLLFRSFSHAIFSTIIFFLLWNIKTAMGIANQIAATERKKTKIMKIYDCECPWSFVILVAHTSRDVFSENGIKHRTCVYDLKHVHQKS